ncbi:hypothetical protein BJ742DRAFT_773564 [Cladochytrium replicatum]|nr:hypothetical protein BJ742DRAFT_773564 [Cladochytrium replicatum]
MNAPETTHEPESVLRRRNVPSSMPASPPSEYTMQDKEDMKEATGGSGNEPEAEFECNICLQTASNPVITMCGHLFCWQCLFRWMQQVHRNSALCPVCKSAISRNTVVPIYGRGRSRDPRDEEIPERPAGQRTEPAPQAMRGGWAGSTLESNAHFGFGAFGPPAVFGVRFVRFCRR